jgi:hypothetical protein
MSHVRFYGKRLAKKTMAVWRNPNRHFLWNFCLTILPKPGRRTEKVLREKRIWGAELLGKTELF